jgi:hypothetical protein
MLGKRNDERITPETLSVLDDAKLELVSAVRYNSEHQPMFTLTLEKLFQWLKVLTLRTFLLRILNSSLKASSKPIVSLCL